MSAPLPVQCPQEKRSKSPKQGNRVTKKTMLKNDVSEAMICQLQCHPSSTSFSSDSSHTILETVPGEENASYTINNILPYESHFESSDNGKPAPASSSQTGHRVHANVFTLDDIAGVSAIEKLTARYGRVSHMTILDPSFSFFVNKARNAALSFKVQNKVALVMGDPMCDPDLFPDILAEFQEYRKKFRWSVAFIGGSEVMARYAKKNKWSTIQFGTERVLNPMTNDVLNERSGKRIIVQSKQLLNPSKGGISLGLYVPTHEGNLGLQKELARIYDAWREERNRASVSQAFVTVYDPFSMLDLMTYIYTKGTDGRANGFAALRKIGANSGYHIDPCIAAPGAPRGISDLLIFAAMALLNSMGVSYLSLGFEPLDSLEDITGMSPPLERITRALYRRTSKQMLFKGKQTYHNKFKPDKSQGSRLYTLFPTGGPYPRQMMAVSRMSNISIRRLFFGDIQKKPWAKKEKNDDKNRKSKW